MTQADGTISSPPAAGPSRLGRVAAAAAAAATCAFTLLLGARTLTTPDLGYHLAFGDLLLDTGHVVDSGLFIHTDPAPPAGMPAEVGPGCWYDSAGRYRFPNANWLSQAAMALVHRAAGLRGLSMLLAALVAGTFALGVATMRRAGLGWLGAAGGVGLMAMVAYERFQLRPEIFGYLVLMAQLALLIGGRVTWRTGAALVVLQWLLVNLHSYFLLGLALTGAVLAERLLRRLWLAARGRGSQGDALRPARAAVAGAAIVLAAQVAVCFANPWTWRLVALPFQTLLFMREHHIAAAVPTESSHPWAVIGEFFSPFAGEIFAARKASYAYPLLLALAAVGGLAAAILRRWAHLLIIAGMAAVSLSMRRNIAPAALIITPPALLACRDLLGPLLRRLTAPATRSALAIATGGVLCAAALYGTFTVVTQRFYRNERLSSRFGLGITPTVVPIGPAEWINAHRPAGRLWTDYNTSSNMYYFTRPRREVPILTNTWSYPPWVMRQVLDCSRGKVPFDSLDDNRRCQIVVLQVEPPVVPGRVSLGPELVADPNWSLVFLDAAHAVFLRADGPNAELARQFAITPRSMDQHIAAYVDRVRRLDPVPSHAALLAGYTLANLGWDTQAVAFYRRVLDEDPYPHRIWTQIGWCLARRGTRRMCLQPPDLRGKQDWHDARNAFLHALKLRGDYAPARKDLSLIDEQIAAERRGIIYQNRW